MQDNPFQAYFDSERTLVPYGDSGDPSNEQDNTPGGENPVAPIEIPLGSPNEPLEISPEKRLGIHYFADDAHYNHSDLIQWLPRLQTLGINWITLQAPLDRAIPQEFIDGLIDSDIQPVIQFNLSLEQPKTVEELTPMFRAYANWGVTYAVLFDRPNLRSQWPGMGWTQRGLVERFLDVFVPLATAAMEAGLTPVFPGLEPGGDYWDTAFLRAALEALNTRGEGLLLEKMALGAYAWTEDRSMTWGAGGPQSWPATMPYHTPENSEDQRGFHIFDWYNAISAAVLGKELPIILLAAGVQREGGKPLDAMQAKRAINMALNLQRDPEKNNGVPANVLACNFWLLAAAPDAPEFHYAWFKINGKETKIAEEWLAWVKGIPYEKTAPRVKSAPAISFAENGTHSIRHYLLLPAAADWPMEAIRAFVQEHQATMGTSEQEAAQATRVTLAGGLEAFSDNLLRTLIQAGCTVDNLQLESA